MCIRDSFQSVNKAISDATHGAVENVTLYSILEDPMTSCGCFECICGIEPMSNGFIVVNREYKGMTPAGMTFGELASCTGGGVQTPGYMGHGRHFISSKKFIAAEGGIERIVWMPKELKDQVRERLDAAAKELGITVDMKYAYGNQFYGDADITAVMDTWYADGTEVVFACGGGIYTSAAEAAKKVNAKVIGVDVDQKGIIDGDYGEGMTVTSAMKGLYPTTINALTDIIVGGKWADYAGKIETLGLVSGDDPAANYVQLAETTQFADGKFSKDDYAALVKGMFDGTITVSKDTSVEPAVTNVNVSWLGNLK